MDNGIVRLQFLDNRLDSTSLIVSSSVSPYNHLRTKISSNIARGVQVKMGGRSISLLVSLVILVVGSFGLPVAAVQDEWNLQFTAGIGSGDAMGMIWSSPYGDVGINAGSLTAFDYDTRVLRGLDPTTGSILWEHSDINAYHSSQQFVYTRGDSSVMSIDPTNGDVNWEYPVNSPFGLVEGDDADSLYLANRNTVYRLDRNTGQELWRYIVADREIVGLSLKTMGEAVFFVTAEDRTRLESALELVALSNSTGSHLWQLSVGGIGRFNLFPFYVVGDAVRAIDADSDQWIVYDSMSGDVIHIGDQLLSYSRVPELMILRTGEDVFATNRAGAELWRLTKCPSFFIGDDGAGLCSNESSVVAVDILDGRALWELTGVIHVVSLDPEPYIVVTNKNEISMIDEIGGAVWTTSLETEIGDQLMNLHDGVLTVSTATDVNNLNSDTGQVIWTVPHSEQKSGFVNLDSSGNLLFVQGREEKLDAYELLTGQHLWQLTLASPYSFHGFSAYTVIGDVTIFSNDVGTIALGRIDLELTIGGWAKLKEDSVLKGASAENSVDRTVAGKGTTVTLIAESATVDGEVWWPVIVNGTNDQGWIRADLLEPIRTSR